MRVDRITLWVAALGFLVPALASGRDDIVLRLTSPNKDGRARLRIGKTEIPIDLTRDDPAWRFSPTRGEFGTAEVRIICDRPFMEVVSGGGRRYQMINRTDRGKPLGEISLERLEGEVEVGEFTVYNMKSIWASLPK